MLWKEDDKRPSANQILGMEFVQKYLNDLVKSKGTALKDVRLLNKQITAERKPMPTAPKIQHEEDKHLTPKEKLRLKKLEESKNRENELNKEAKKAFEVMEK